MKRTGSPTFKKGWYKHEKFGKKIKLFFNDIRYAHQRIKYGWCDKDTWDMDMWFLNVIPQMLRHLRKHTHGYPATMTMEEWDRTLRRMIYLFEEADANKCHQKNEYGVCPSKNNMQKWMDRSIEIDNYRVECLHKGLRLFSKYFYNLWD